MDSCVWFRKSYMSSTISTGNQVSYLYRYGTCRAKALSLFQHVTVAAFSFFCELRHKARKAATLERQLRSRHAKKARSASRVTTPLRADLRRHQTSRQTELTLLQIRRVNCLALATVNPRCSQYWLWCVRFDAFDA